MGLALGSQMPAKITKPYVYRGTGEDPFPETGIDLSPPEPKPVAPTVEEYRARERERASEVARMKRIAKRKRERYVTTVRTRLDPPTPVFLDDLDINAPDPKDGLPAPVHLSQWQAKRQEKPRPAKGWKPLAGADLDELLNEIE
jgi:hypothetical protein